MKSKLLILAVLLMTTMAHAMLRIVTTTPDFADIAKQVGQDHVEVHSVMKGPENVHNVLATPTEMVLLNKADLFVHSGLDAEPWRDNLLKGARNPKLAPGQPGNVDMSSGIELRDVPTGRIDRSMGDIHAYGNPHYSIHPANAQRMAATLVKAMAQLDAENAALFRENAKKFVNDMAETHRRLLADLAPYRGLKVVTYHKAWDYFADAFALEIVATVEPKPAITPSPAEIKRLIDLMREKDVKIVIVETYSSFAQAKAVADKVGAQVIVLPDHVSGVAEADTYQRLFQYDVGKIVEAARAAGIEPADNGRLQDAR